MSLKSTSKSSSVLLASLLSTIVLAGDQGQKPHLSMSEQLTEMPADLLKSVVLQLLQKDDENVQEDLKLAYQQLPHTAPNENGLDDNALKRKKKKKKKAQDPKPEPAELLEQKTPAQKQKEENAKHFEELTKLKREAGEEDYELKKPVKPERQEHKPSDTDIDKEAAEGTDEHEEPDANEDGPKVKENTLLDDENEVGNEINPFEEALKDNKNQKKRFMEELKREVEERKKREKEEKEAKEQEERDHKEWLEGIYLETGEMPPELAEIYAEEEKKRQEEEAKKRPEPPSAKTMRERVAEESKRRKDARLAEMRHKDEEDRKRKLKERQEETERRRKVNPNYKPPSPITVPKGRPLPPADYKYPEKARKHGWGDPLDDPEEKKKQEEKKLKEEEEREMKEIEELAEQKLKEYNEQKEKDRKTTRKAQREREREDDALDELERHGGPQPETKRKPQKKHADDQKQPHPETKRTPTKKDKKRKRRKPASTKPDSRESKPKPEHTHPKVTKPNENIEDEMEQEEEQPVHKPSKEPKKQPKHEEPVHLPPVKMPKKDQVPKEKPAKKSRAPKKAPKRVPSFDGQDDFDTEEIQKPQSHLTPHKAEKHEPLQNYEEPVQYPHHQEHRHLEPVHYETKEHKPHQKEEPKHQPRAEPHRQEPQQHELPREAHRAEPRRQEPHRDEPQQPEPKREAHRVEPRRQPHHQSEPHQTEHQRQEPLHQHLQPVLLEPDQARYYKKEKSEPQLHHEVMPQHFDPIEHRYLVPVAPEPEKHPSVSEKLPVELDVPQFTNHRLVPMLPMAHERELEHDDWLSWPKYDEQAYYEESQMPHPAHHQPVTDHRHEYEHKYLELDKKTGHEHGRLSESEKISSDDQQQIFEHVQPRKRQPRDKRQYHDSESYPMRRQKYQRWVSEESSEYQNLRSSHSDHDRFDSQFQQRHYTDAHYKEPHQQQKRHKQYEQRRTLEDLPLAHPHQPEPELQRKKQQHQQQPKDMHAVLPWPSSPDDQSDSVREEDSSMDEFYKDQGYKRRQKNERKKQSPSRRQVGPKNKRHITDKWKDVPYQEIEQDYFEDDYWQGQKEQQYQRKQDDRYDFGYHTEPVSHSDLELFKQSYDYEDAQTDQKRQHEGNRNQRSQMDYQTREQRQPYPSEDLFDGKRTRQRRRKDQYYSQEEEQLYHEPRPYRQSRKPVAKKGKRHRKKLHPSLVPTKKAGAEAIPQTPAQQYVIPTQPLRDTDNDENESSSSSQINPRDHESIVPVMRRYGEPLMVMPDWKNLKEEENPQGRLPSRYQNEKEQPQYLHGPQEQDMQSISSEERRFEALAHRKANYRSKQLNSLPLEDDLAQVGLMEYFETQEPHQHKTTAMIGQAANRVIKRPKRKRNPRKGRYAISAHYIESTETEDEESSYQDDYDESDSDYDSEQDDYTDDDYDEEEEQAPRKKKQKQKKQKPIRQHRRRVYSDDEQDDIDPPYDDYDDEEEVVDSEEIIDQFRKVMDMLRHHQSQNGGLMDEFAEVKESLRKGEHLDELQIEQDWRPNLIEPMHSRQSEKLSLHDLLADEEKLIAKYEQKIKAREERRKAAQQEEENFLSHIQPIPIPQVHVPQAAVEYPLLNKPVKFEIGSLHDHKTGDVQEMVDDPSPEFHFLQHSMTAGQLKGQQQFRQSREAEIHEFEVIRQDQSEYGSDETEGADDEVYGLDDAYYEYPTHQHFVPINQPTFSDYYGDQNSQWWYAGNTQDYLEDDYYLPIQNIKKMQRHYNGLEQSLPSQPSLRGKLNDLVPNYPVDNSKKKKKKAKPTEGPAPSKKKGKKPTAPVAPEEKSQKMQQQMDFLTHQRMLKDRSMRRKLERQNPKGLPALPLGRKPTVPSKDKIDPITKQPLLDGEQKQFDMMDFMKRQLKAKEKEMLAREKQDPTYKPLSPTAKKPTAVPKKNLDKLHEAEEKRRLRAQRDGGGPGDDKGMKDRSLFDRLSKERMLREQQLREADPDYQPLSPSAIPTKAKPRKRKKKRGPSGQPDIEQDSIFEQMQKRRQEHQRKLLEEDAKRAAEDPTYTPKYKGIPANPDVQADPKDELQRRLDEARRKHLIDKEEQFEDLYSEDAEDEYGLQDDYGSNDDEDEPDSLEDDDDDEYTTNLDYYYDSQGFAHPKRTKSRFGRERGDIPAPQHKPIPRYERSRPQRQGRRYRRNQQDESYSSDEEDQSYSSSDGEDSFEDDDDESSSYDHRYKPVKRQRRDQFSDEDDEYDYDQYSSVSSDELPPQRSFHERKYHRPVKPVKHAKPATQTRPARLSRPTKSPQRHPVRRYRNELIEAPQGPQPEHDSGHMFY